MQNKYLLTADLGASNGRVIVYEFDGAGFRPVFEHRFQNGIVTLNHTAYWDFLYLFRNIKLAIQKAACEYPLHSIGLDTWGLDFGLLDDKGYLMENPVSYRDKRTLSMPEILHTEVCPKELYAMTGAQDLPNNTIYQLYSLMRHRRDFMERADKMLMMPDLLSYFLTGEKHAEFTVSSTTGLLDITKLDWNRELLDRIGVPRSMFLDILFPGEQAFPLRSGIQNELNVGGIPLVTTASHDSASAVISVPFSEKKSLFVSSGTWSILGVEVYRPKVDDVSFSHNIANEGGYGKSIRRTRNLMGLWLIQECMRCWHEAGKQVSYSDIDEAVVSAAPFASFFDPQAGTLQNKYNMPAEIARLCSVNGLKAPESVGEFARCIYESIALNYRRAIQIFEKEQGDTFACIHVVGGGSRVDFLNRCIASATGLTVIAGPKEATAYGNVFAQLHWSGDIASIQEFRGIVRGIEGEIVQYEPKNTQVWDEAYAKFLRLESNG